MLTQRVRFTNIGIIKLKHLLARLIQRCDCDVLDRAEFASPNICYVSSYWLELSEHRGQVRRLADKLRTLNATNFKLYPIRLFKIEDCSKTNHNSTSKITTKANRTTRSFQ